MWNFLVVVVNVIALLMWYLWKKKNYWNARNVPNVPANFLVGNMKEVFFVQKSQADVIDEIYKKYDDHKYIGVLFYGSPALLIRDNELIKDVLIKDFHKFEENSFELDEKLDPILSKNPFFAKGDHWKQIRNQLTPQFTPMKIKKMFPLMDMVKDKLTDYLRREPLTKSKDGLNAKELAAKYTIEMVASCAFGLEANAFTDPNSKFCALGKEIFNGSYFSIIELMVLMIFPELRRLKKSKFLSDKVTKEFKHILTSTIKQREEMNIKRGDFLDIIVEMKQSTTSFDYNEDYMTAHALSFFLDGFETSAVVLQFVLYELGANLDVQENLREKFEEMLKNDNGKLVYDSLQDLKYLDMIIEETLRKYPPLFTMMKTCTETTKFPPAKDGLNETLVEKGTFIIIPVMSIHNDPNYYENPEEFIPERFDDAAKESRPKQSFLGFGDGPRICLGRRFAIMQIKVAVFAVLTNFDVRVSEKTPKKFVLEPMEFIYTITGGIWLNFYDRIKKE